MLVVVLVHGYSFCIVVCLRNVESSVELYTTQVDLQL